MQRFVASFLVLGVVHLIAGCGPDAATKQLIEQSRSQFGPIPARMPGAEKDTPELVALGEKLYNDKRLSLNDTQSCASCHILQNKAAGVDNKRVSPGAGALSAAEKEGLRLFMATGCTTCHAGPLLGGHMFQKMGLVRPYTNTKDRGQSVVTKKPEHDFFFKVPSLRNVALTAPYFHDGGAKTLEEAVSMMAGLQLGRDLKPGEVSSIVAFLGSLSDKSRAR